MRMIHTRTILAMRSMLAARGLAVAGLVAAIVLVPVNGAADAARSSVPLVSSLYGVSAVSASDAWAVGSVDTSITEGLTLHWNGHRWLRVPIPISGSSSLSDVSAISASDAWAVGAFLDEDAQSTTWNTLALRWNGSRWTQVPIPTRGYGAVLTAVTALSASDAWAVGYFHTLYSTQTLVLHWNGQLWSPVPIPTPGLITLADISAKSPSDVWAVGQIQVPNSFSRSLVLHWDGSKWIRVASPSLPNSALTGVAVLSASDAWAVGSGNRGHRPTLIIHWNGQRWARVPSPSPANGAVDANTLAAVSATSHFDAWAAGYFVVQGGTSRTLMEQWNGTHWTRLRVPDPGGSLVRLFTDVSSVSESDAWAVGYLQNQVLVEHWNGVQWVQVPTP